MYSKNRCLQNHPVGPFVIYKVSLFPFSLLTSESEATTTIGMGGKDDKRVDARLAWRLAILVGVTAPWVIEFLFT